MLKRNEPSNRLGQMVMQRVEIELPESVYRQLAKIAEETAQPIVVLAA